MHNLKAVEITDRGSAGNCEKQKANSFIIIEKKHTNVFLKLTLNNLFIPDAHFAT